LGNIQPDDVPSLKALRCGLRGDSFLSFLPEALPGGYFSIETTGPPFPKNSSFSLNRRFRFSSIFSVACAIRCSSGFSGDCGFLLGFRFRLPLHLNGLVDRFFHLSSWVGLRMLCIL
jgi:hypothetical protein